MRLSLSPVLVLLFALGLSACDLDSRPVPPDVSVRVLHTAPSYDGITYMREERAEGTLAFKTGRNFEFDADQYDFHLEITPVGETARTRVESYSSTLTAGNDYFVVFTEIGGVLQAITLEQEEFTGSESEVRFLHVATTFAPMDVFIQPLGTDLTAVAPSGSLEFGEDTAPFQIDSGQYVITLTEAGNPAGVLVETREFNLGPGVSVLFAIGDGEGLAALDLTAIGAGGTQRFVDAGIESSIRVINSVSDRADRDIAIDGEFSTPLIASLAYATASAYQDVDSGTRELGVTPAGNPGVVELEQEFTAQEGRYMTLLLTGTPDDPIAYVGTDDLRPFPDAARLRLLNGTTEFGAIEYYVVEPGTGIGSATPTVIVPSTIPAAQTFAPGDYEVTLRDQSAGVTIAGSVTITMAAGGLYTLLAVNAVDPGDADVVLLDDFN